MTSALFALLLAGPARAAERAPAPAPRPASKLECPDGRAPIMTGHPFLPLSCPPGGKEPARHEVAVSTAMAPLDSKSGGDLGKLDGTWEGLIYFAGRRFECTLTVSEGGTHAVWVAEDYATHLGHPMEARLKKPGWLFHRGVPRVELSMPHLPNARLHGRVWLAPGVAAWKFDGRPEVHRVEYTLAGDRLTGGYTDFDPDHGAVSAGVELRRRP
jgi:hypothetical protein